MLTVDFDIFDVNVGDVILDAGCGEGRHSIECVLQGANVYSMDLDLASLRKARYTLTHINEKDRKSDGGRFQVHIGNALDLPFKEKTFDRIICSEVMEHVTDDDLACKELVRTLKNGGKIVITVPTTFSEYLYGLITDEYFTSPGGHIRKYLPGKLIKIMKNNNLEIYNIRFKHSFHAIYWLIRCVVGLHLEDHVITKTYKNFLVLTMQSNLMKKIESFFDFFFPKSMVVYAYKK
ncbi:MAG: class I SAM-dependent methyltransferase [Spirochaetota bacterium]|nr:class I SAM-dependent methyltransferase [Spirochaetota bacterium]